jgi:hypothetical protein
VPLGITEIGQEGGLSPSCGPPQVWTAETDHSADLREPNGGGPLLAVDDWGGLGGANSGITRIPW